MKKLYQVLKDGSKVHPGNWRIEVSPVAKLNYDSFLHILTPTDRSGARAAEATGIRSDDGRLTGLLVDDWLVMFTELQGVGQETRYRVARTGSTNHLLLGVEKNASYVAELEDEDGTVIETMRLESSPEETLQFSTDSQVIVSLKSL